MYATWVIRYLSFKACCHLDIHLGIHLYKVTLSAGLSSETQMTYINLLIDKTVHIEPLSA